MCNLINISAQLEICDDNTQSPYSYKPYVHLMRDPKNRNMVVNQVEVSCLIINPEQFEIDSIREVPEKNRLILDVFLANKATTNSKILSFKRDVSRSGYVTQYGYDLKEIQVLIKTSSNPDKEGTVVVNYDDPDGDD